MERSQGKKDRIECRYHKQWGEKARRCNPKCPCFAQEQESDADCQAAPTAVTDLKMENVKFAGVRRSVLCDVSQAQPRFYVPQQWRRKIFGTIHSLAHPSGKSTLKMITRNYVWHNMKRDILQWAKECDKCSMAKVGRHVKPPIKPLEVPASRFEHVHVNLVGLLPVSNGYKYLLTISAFRDN